MFSLCALSAHLHCRLYRFAGVLAVAAWAGACAPVAAGYGAGPQESVAGIAPRILNASYVPGARDFCARNPRDCAPGQIATLSAWQEEAALSINRAVNHALTWTAPELGPKHMTNPWHILNDGGKGPCTDFAATKLDRMLQAGLPGGAFSFALVHVDGNPASILHLVLVANFHDGLYVLDSRDDRLWRPQEISDYAWLSYRSFGAPAVWHPGVPDPTAETGDLRLADYSAEPHAQPAGKPAIVLVASPDVPHISVTSAPRRHAGRRHAHLG